MSIKILDPEVIDQIAAGEVVERPAHLLKELIENSLDAGAEDIEIQVSNGGRTLSILDNGAGMEPEDLRLCVDRHATSKISRSADLFQLSSFGFRGEALASIAAISELKISTRTQSRELASRMSVEFGQKSDVTEVGGAQGTRISVDHLFDNVPARKKFLKSDTAEMTQVKQVVRAMGLAYPTVGLRLNQGEKNEFDWSASATEDEFEAGRVRAERILGQPLYSARAGDDELRVECYFSAPHHVARTSRQMWFFAQGRWIQDRSLQAAVTEAYRNYLMHGEFPFAVVKVYLNPENIDVNIHPTKSQVKFHDSRAVFRIIHHTIRDVLEKAPWLESTVGKGVNATGKVQPVQEYTPSFDEPTLKKTQFAQKKSMLDQLRKFAGPNSKGAQGKSQIRLNPVAARPSSQEENQTRHMDSANEPRLSKAIFRETDASSVYWAGLQVLGQANLTYIITQSDRGIIFVDQHAAHERVLFERLKRAFDEGEVETQRFLIPLGIDLQESEVEALLSEIENLRRLGIHVEQTSPTHVVISEAPSLIKEAALARAVTSLAHEISERGGSFAIDHVVSDIFATMACHSAIRAGQSLTSEQMSELLEQMDEHKSSFCPHGRPVFVEYDFGKLETDFGRRV